MYDAQQFSLDLFDNGPVVVFVWENKTDWPVVSVTKNLSSLYGYEPQRYLSQELKYSDQIHPDDLPRAAKEVADACNNLESNSFAHAPYRYCDGYGKYRWVKDSSQIIRSSDGEITHFVGYLLDITQEMELREEKHHFLERHYLALDGAGDGLWDWNLLTNEVFFSDQWKKMLGFEPNEISGSLEEWSKRVHVDDLENVYIDIQKCLSSKVDVYRNEHRVLCKDGEYKWVLDCGVVVEWDDGKPARMIGTHTDISGEVLLRKENEFQKNMLKETNKKLVNISENIPGMIYTYQLFPDGKSCFPYASEHIYDVYGVRPSEVVDDAVKIFDVLSPDDIGHVVETIMHSRDTLTLWEDEYRVNHPKKGLIWLKGASKPERQADGSTLWYGYIHETTLQKQLEIELQEKKEAAEASVRSKAEFLAAMSHEIRTPMNGVLGMLSLLDRSELDVVQRHQLRVAASSATSLLGLINDILDFSKIDAGKMDLEHLEFHLVDELQALCESMQFKAQEKGLSLILDTQAVDYPTIVTDPGRLRQVLTNLVSNAVKFTSEGRIAITVSLKPIREGRGRLKIDVSDTGIGIPSEKIPMLFESFTQADSSTTRQFGGTGLGLSIVKKLCELMGGSISATSVVGSGSVFRIDLEIDLGGDIATLSSRRANGETQAKEMIAWPPTTRILLVEDNTTNQIVAQGMLELFGLSADIAANGIEAIEAIKLASTTLPYTVVLMDCQMPEMDGYEATKAVRLGQALRVNQSIPIIAMTANAMSGDREKCMIAGMDDYISKPINIDSLKTVLMKWILHAQERPLVGEILEEKFVEYLLWDEEDALNRLANKRTLLNRIIEAFITDSLMSLELLAKALEEQNSADAQLHAHSLKGSAANVSALKLYNISKQLEEAAKNNNLLEVQKGFLQCQQILDETLSVFKLYLSKERS